eukprot:Nk52_evm49s248 gene=Nk52_evmTU49s248
MRGVQENEYIIIGSWRIQNCIEGASGLRQAVHLESGKFALVRTIQKQELSESDLESLKDQIFVLYSLKGSDRVLNLLDVVQNEDKFFLVYEYFSQTGTLMEYVLKQPGGRLRERKAVSLFRQICDAVQHCHSRGVVHRDLKLPNIALDETRRNIRIIDFTYAVTLKHSDILSSPCGSPGYISPEILSGSPYSGTSSDVWALGVILFTLLVGKYPFLDSDPEKLFSKIKRGSFSIPRHMSPEAADLVSKILVVDSSRRLCLNDILKHPFLETSSESHTKAHDPDSSMYDQVVPGCI